MIEPVAHEEALQQAKIFVSTIAGIDVGALSIHSDMILMDEQIADLGEMLEQVSSLAAEGEYEVTTLMLQNHGNTPFPAIRFTVIVESV